MLEDLQTLDLYFQDRPHTIASYLLPYSDGVILIETGPGSTAAMLQARLAQQGYTPNDVTEVLLTHIHLDHAGAAGWLASDHGAEVYVHPIGAPHLANPERLLESAQRIYGDDMDALWGEMRPTPKDQLITLQNGDTVTLGEYQVVALDTPGHASHHLSYVIGDVCFTGDVGGVRLPGESYVELPLAPPEIDLDAWRRSLSKLRQAVDRHEITHLAPTHFGLYADVQAHLDQLESAIEKADAWSQERLPNLVDDGDRLRSATTEWMREQAADQGVDDATWELYELANPSWMAALGLRRYWDKHVAEA